MTGCEFAEQGEAIARMEGITCGLRKTSCPDQIAQCLREAAAKL